MLCYVHNIINLFSKSWLPSKFISIAYHSVWGGMYCNRHSWQSESNMRALYVCANTNS